MTPLAMTRTAYARPQRSIERSETPARATGTAQVLVIDTDTDRRELLADAVTRAGGRPAVADTGAETIARLDANTPDCLLVADLPDGSSRALIQWARPRFPEMAIVAVAEGAKEQTELYHAGADLVAPMPLDADLLGAKLAAAMRSAQRSHLRLVPA